jgi:hypothetical protein
VLVVAVVYNAVNVVVEVKNIVVVNAVLVAAVEEILVVVVVVLVVNAVKIVPWVICRLEQKFYSCLKYVMKQSHANVAAANDDHNGSDVDDNNNSNDNNNNSKLFWKVMTKRLYCIRYEKSCPSDSTRMNQPVNSFVGCSIPIPTLDSVLGTFDKACSSIPYVFNPTFCLLDVSEVYMT